MMMACVAMLLAAAACRPVEESADEPMTQTEAEQALVEAQLSQEGEALTSGVIEISTNFTIGGAIEEAAENLRSFAQSQIPCSTVTRAEGQVTIDGDYAYLGYMYGPEGTSIVDISDPRNPRLVTTIMLQNKQSHSPQGAGGGRCHGGQQRRAPGHRSALR